MESRSTMEEPSVTSLAATSAQDEPGEAAPARDDARLSPALRSRYELVSVELTSVPEGGQGTDWCRYVLSCGTSRITGLHRGTLEEVTSFAVSCVEDFNARSATGKAKGSVTSTMRKPPPSGARRV